MLKNYYTHFLNNKQSLITKIYGLYKFEDLDNNPIILILMRNIANCPDNYIFRKYDIKGSTSDREVLRYEVEEKINQDRNNKFSYIILS